jgi:branched-chain amino acid transport system ATP-binding protein
VNEPAGQLLSVRHLQARYGRLQVLWDISLEVCKGEFVALIGANGAGKTTILRAISGVIRPSAGEVTFLGQSIGGMPAHKISRTGLGYITEDLNLFEAMSVQDNLLLGVMTRQDGSPRGEALNEVYQLFPILSQRRRQLAGTLSGGERRMLALGRGLMSHPQLLMVDEPSLGLAPRLVLTVFDALTDLHRRGVTILLVEQNVNHTLSVADKAYVVEHGRMVLQGPSAELLQNEYLREAYLGRR